MEVYEYSPEREQEWNEFVDKSINSTFLFDRGYMEYHSEKYEPYSLMVYYKDRPLALLPANREDDSLVSHGWLTFGGFLVDSEMTMSKMMDVFECVESFLEGENINRIRYKAIPSIYHSIPAEGDRYALFRTNADRYRCDVSSAIPLSKSPGFKRNRRQMIERAAEHDISVRRTDKLETYWEMLRKTLAKHDVEPVHSVNEMELLVNRFPDNIHLEGAFLDGDFVSGAIVYESDEVARTQYIASTEKGDEIRATDFLLSELITNKFDHKSFFDFGISTENDGEVLNEGLSYYKETFGARPVVHDFYEWVIGE